MTERIVEIGNFATDRYAAMQLIPWWDQARIAAARVLVVGAGALGNEVLKNLALLGTGYIAVLDRDVVEVSNLTRSVLYRADDAGRPKACVAAERLCELNPDVRAIALHGRLERIAGVGLVRRFDAVFGCLDNAGARVALNRLCAGAGVPWIDGSLDVLMGAVRTFIPPDGPCYECTMAERDYALAGLRHACAFVPEDERLRGRIPTTPTSASIVAALQVQEWLKLLHGRAPTPGQRIFFEGSSLRLRVLIDARRRGCPGHRRLGEIARLPLAAGATLAAVLSAANARLGEPSVLLCDREVVTGLDCPRCGRHDDVHRPLDEVAPGGLACQSCGAERTPDIAVRLHAGGAAGDVAVGQLGVPPLGPVIVETAAGRRAAFELGGDTEGVLPGWPMTASQEVAT